MNDKMKSIEEVRDAVLADFSEVELQMLAHLAPALKEIGLGEKAQGVFGQPGVSEYRLAVAREILSVMPEGWTANFGPTHTLRSAAVPSFQNLPKTILPSELPYWGKCNGRPVGFSLSEELKKNHLIDPDLFADIARFGSVRRAIAHAALLESTKDAICVFLDKNGITDIKHGVHDEFIVETKAWNGEDSTSQLEIYRALSEWFENESKLPLQMDVAQHPYNADVFAKGRTGPLLIEDFNKPLTKKQRAESYISKRTQDELDTEVKQLRDFVVNVLLAAKMQEKPNTWLRKRLQEVKKSGEYAHLPIVAGAINHALKKALAMAYLDGVFAEIIAAVDRGDE